MQLLGRHTWLLMLVLVVVTLLLYSPVRHQPFANIDDSGYAYDNVHLRTGWNAEFVHWAFTTYFCENWHPITWFSHSLDYTLFGLYPAGHHETNLILHVLDAVLLFWVLKRATGYTWRSYMVAAMFALHPINVESVAWVAERKTMLSTLFFLLTLAAYQWYARKPRVGRYVVVAVLFSLGLMAKPQIIMLPAVLLLWDFWPLRRLFPNLQERPPMRWCRPPIAAHHVAVAMGEGAAGIHLPGQRVCDHAGAEGGASAVLGLHLSGAAGERHRQLCPVYRQSAVALAAGHTLSPSRQLHTVVAGGGGIAHPAGNFGLGGGARGAIATW